MLNNIYRYIIAVTVIILLSACNDEVDYPTMPSIDSPGSLTITISNSNMSRSSASDNSEVLIDNLAIGLYPLTADEDAKASAWATFSYLDKSQSATVTLYLSDELSTALFNNTDGAKCRLFVLANVPEGVEVTPYASIKEMKSLALESPFDTKDVQESFIMTGQSEEVKYSAPAVQGQKGKAKGSVELTRAAAKIQLKLALPEKIDITDDTGNVVETWSPIITDNALNVTLNNGVNKATAVPADMPEDEGSYFNSNLRTLDKETGEYPFVMGTPFYTYPNVWTESAEETHKTTMTLIVPWHKEGTPQGTYTTYYYQVPIIPTDATSLKSNHSYIVNLTVGMLGSLVPDTPVDVDDVSYQIVKWGEETVEVPIEDYRYLVVNPNVYSFNNEVNMSIPYYTSHPVEIVNVKITYQRFNFISDVENPDVGRVVTFTIDEDQIKATNDKYETTPLCTSSLSETSGQKYLNIYHPLNLWRPCKEDGTEVTLIGHNTLSDTTMVAESIKYYQPLEDNAFSMYTITCTIRHEDRPDYKEDIVIYQYPAIYIEADRNPASKPEGNVFVNGFTNIRATSLNGVPSYGSTTGITGWYEVDADGNSIYHEAQNKNPNMYIINITSLSEADKFSIEDEATGQVTTYQYIIGDPRSKFWTNRFKTTETSTDLWTNQKTRTDNSEPTTKSWSIPAPALYTAPDISSDYTEQNPFRRTLAYYYITLEDGTVTNMVAPRFRVASSWGVTSSISRVYARYRAALYQENAYPAGRWRIPTVAEFSYINKLSGEGKIPQLFTYNVPYWTSDGLYKGDAQGKIYRVANQAQKRAVRAVYDEWYWSLYPQFSITPDANGAYTYTLGDVPRGVQ